MKGVSAVFKPVAFTALLAMTGVVAMTSDQPPRPPLIGAARQPDVKLYQATRMPAEDSVASPSKQEVSCHRLAAAAN